VETEELKFSMSSINFNFILGNCYRKNDSYKFDSLHWCEKKDAYYYYYFIKDFFGSDENFCIRTKVFDWMNKDYIPDE
jgi:hypothetical protein